MHVGHPLLSRHGGVARTSNAAIWHRPPSLWVTRFWGRPSEDDARQTVATWDIALWPDAAPTFVSLVDARHLAGIDASAFAVLYDYMRHRGTEFHQRMTRQALVRPEGLAGSVVSGTLAMLEYRMPVQVFTELAPAFAWLTDEDGASLAREMEARVGDSDTRSALLAILRDRLARKPDALEARDVAPLLGMSVRTLQRRLRDAGTSFSGELNAARIELARELLIHSDDKITSIARRVGIASPPYFARLFRTLVGETPEAFRKRHRPE